MDYNNRMDIIEKNIPRMYIFKFLKDFVLVMPIIVPFFKSFGLSLTQIMLIQSVFALTMIICEIPTGYISDSLGRRKTLITGSLFITLGYLIYSLSWDFYHFMLAEAVFAMGSSLCSGTDSALIFDSLKVSGKESQYLRTEGKAEFFSRSGTMAASILGGILAAYYMRLPFYVSVATSLIMTTIALYLFEPSRKTTPKIEEAYRNIVRVVRESLEHKEILAVMMLSSSIMSTCLISIWGYLALLNSYHANVAVFGIFFALFQLSSAIGARYSHYIKDTLGDKRSFYLLLGIPSCFLLLLLPFKALLLIAFVNSAVWGFSTPFLLEKINILIESDRRATVLSTSSMISRILFILVSPLFGVISDLLSINLAFIVLAGLVLLSWTISSKQLA